MCARWDESQWGHPHESLREEDGRELLDASPDVEQVPVTLRLRDGALPRAEAVPVTR
jgi:hypothetical protein